MPEKPTPANNDAAGEAVKAYMDAKRFPLTTQAGLTLSGQKMIDAVNKDDLRQMREHGEALNGEQEAIWLELEAKSSLKAAKTAQAQPPRPSAQS